MATHIINIGQTSIPGGLINMVKDLPDINNLKSGDKITLHFGREFVFLSTLTLLATWRKSLPAGVSVAVDDHSSVAATQNMITNSGFREIIETGHETPSVQKRIGKLPLRPITNRLNKDSVVQDITSMLSDNTALIDDIKPLTTILSEICENALTHSGFASPGYVCATLTENDQKRRFEIAICDSGMGFNGSYLSGSNDVVKTRINKGASPIEIAIEGLNSSKPLTSPDSVVSYFGFGLYITRRLVEENRGQMFILSRDDALMLNNRARNSIEVSRPFPGTLIVIILDLDNPLPLEQIYAEAVEDYTGSAMLKEPPETIKPEKQKVTHQAITSKPASGKLETNPTMAIIELRHFGTELLTREAGLAIRAELATLILAVGSVEVNLDGISDITPSVADEAFAKLAEKIGLELFERSVKFVGGTSLVMRLIEFVMKTRIK